MVLAAAATASMAHAAGDGEMPVALWTSFVVVGGELRSDGMVAGCEAPGSQLMENGYCMVPGLVAKMAGRPTAKPLQAFLEGALAGRTGGKKPIAVGVIPHWQSSGGRNPGPVMAMGQFVILYKLEP